MAKTDYKTVAAYIAAQPKPAQKALRQVRAAIRKALPDAEEVISYQIAAFRLHGRVVIYFAGWAHHYSIYPATKKVITTFKSKLAPYELSKGTIRFPLDGPVPTKLIADIAKVRAQEAAVAEQFAKAKKRAKPRKR